MLGLNMTAARKEHVISVLNQLEEIKRMKRDYIYPASKLGVDDEGRLVLGGTDTFKVGTQVYTEWKDAEAAADKEGARIEPLGKAGSLPLSRTAETQLAGKLGVPTKYLDGLRSQGHNDLAAYNLRTLLSRNTDKFLLRTLQGRVRAVLSNAYRIMDNYDVFDTAAGILQEAQAQVWHVRLGEDSFELFAVSRTIAGEVASSGHYQGQTHGWWHQGGSDDATGVNFSRADAPLTDKDSHYAAVRISNSETGRGGLHVEPVILRALCNNSTIIGKKMSAIHLGRRQEEEGLVYQADTIQAEKSAALLKLRDTVKTCFDPDLFAGYIAKLNGLTGEKLDKPEAVVQAITEEFSLSAERHQGILRSLFQADDLSRYGLIQATTYQAHAADEAGDTEEASLMEEIGGRLIDMSREQFASMSR